MPTGLHLKKEDSLLVDAPVGGRSEKPKVTAVRILVAGAIGLLLYFAHVAFVPIALACLFALVLSGPVEMLHGLHVPRSASAVLLMLVLLGMVWGISDMLYEPAQHWFAEAPHTLKMIEKKFRPMAQSINRVEAWRNPAGNRGAAPRPQAQSPASPPEETAPFMLLDATR